MGLSQIEDGSIARPFPTQDNTNRTRFRIQRDSNLLITVFCWSKIVGALNCQVKGRYQERRVHYSGKPSSYLDQYVRWSWLVFLTIFFVLLHKFSIVFQINS